MNQSTIIANADKDTVADAIVPVKDNGFCKLVNDVIGWRVGLGDAITQLDYIDFSTPRTTEELVSVTLAVNEAFESFGMSHRVYRHMGVIAPSVV